MTRAAWWFRHHTHALLREVEDPRWDLILAEAPNPLPYQSPWPRHLRRIDQGRGDLGDRMGRILRGMPPGPVCIIGADIAGVTRRRIARAFAALGDHDAVFGPAFDGGYWLVGMARKSPPPPSLFQNVRWSTDHALADTMASLGGMSIAQIDRLRDIDTVADLDVSP